MDSIQWWAEVVFDDVPDTITEDQASKLVAELPGFGTAEHAGNRIRLSMIVDADAIDTATVAAIQATRDTYAEAFGTGHDPAEVRVLTAEQRDTEVAHPGPVDLAGIGDIATMLGVSRQRAHQLTSRADFPAPIGATSSGPVFTRDSISVFAGTWHRQTGRPKQ